MKIAHLKGVKFDDFTENDPSGNWSQICGSCQSKHAQLKPLLNDHGQGSCGVVGCNNEDSDNTVYINTSDAEYSIVFNGVFVLPLDANFVCNKLSDDDCQKLIMENYSVSESIAWNIIDQLWETFGRK
jgi:hypothetical protein